MPPLPHQKRPAMALRMARNGRLISTTTVKTPHGVNHDRLGEQAVHHQPETRGITVFSPVENLLPSHLPATCREGYPHPVDSLGDGITTTFLRGGTLR